MKYLLPILMPFIFGLALAYSVQKPAELLSRRIPRLNKNVCCIILTSGLLLTTAIVIIGIISSLCAGAMNFCPCIPKYFDRAVEQIHTYSRESGVRGGKSFFYYASVLAEWLIDFFSENYKKYLPELLTRSTSLISGIPSFFAAAFFGVISALLACCNYDGLTSAFQKLLPDKAFEMISMTASSAVNVVASLLKTYCRLMLITFCELAVGLTIIRLMGFDTGNVITTALLISFIDILPVLGTGTVLIPWGIFELITGNTLYGIMLLILFTIIGVARNFLEPKLIGKRFELPPFITLACVYIGALLFGALGIIALPLAVIILRNIMQEKRCSDSISN